MSGKKVLVTGGGGYIGSHCILQLLEHGFEVVAVDNYENATKGQLPLILFSSRYDLLSRLMELAFEELRC